ncbi:MAG: VCBS repeat-containing protein [Planctomycetes bacterium]|nr:VCBS repeat-containing protein [Planctomycetota bacterium]
MKWARTLLTLSVICSLAAISSAQEPAENVRWRKVTINDQSQFEACGVADFNGDGKRDIFCGDSWYEAPAWTRHKVRDVPPSANPHYYEDFADCPLDCNGDGRPDIVTCNYFGRRVGWVENPGGDATAPWKEHLIETPGSSETGELIDLNNDGRLDFLPNVGNTVVWYELVEQKPKVVWKKHVLGPEGAGHGIGVGDINSDGRLDVITPKGWYQQPLKADTERWVFHKEFDLGAASIFILGRDIDGDGKTDIVWGMGHNYGLYWLKQSTDAKGQRIWTKHDIDTSFSQVHTLLWADLEGTGTPQLVTGKRIYAHETEPGATDKPCIYYFKFDRTAKAGQGTWTRHTIYEGEPAMNAPAKAQDRWALKDFPRGSAGTGLQMPAIDIDGDGDVDLICPGKSGLYLFENLRK